MQKCRVRVGTLLSLARRFERYMELPQFKSLTMSKKAIIIGAGPAGLTAAYELLKRTDIVPIILEKSGEIGGISRTSNYKGNRMDMGPHRFFSKSDRVMDWWLQIMPLDEGAISGTTVSYQGKSRAISFKSLDETGGPESNGKGMLIIQRLTRIYFLRKFFAYPIQISLDTLRTLGFLRTVKILLSFLWIRLFPRRPERNLEDFIINKFGRQLYLLFFKDYTEKVWGIVPSEISAEWGAQRIKGVSLGKAMTNALKSIKARKSGQGVRQKGKETSLIEQFLYPKYGPGSLWEEVATKIKQMGGKLYFHQDVCQVVADGERIVSIVTTNTETGHNGVWDGGYFFSTMPVQELIAGMGDGVPIAVQKVAAGLQYRDFINVGVLLKELSDKSGKRLDLKDNWIYIQERDVKVGRLMIYNNWGGGMVKDTDTTWIGMEYFCNKTDALWALSDEELQRLAISELEQMELARAEDVLDSTVRRMEKTYPAYFGTYGEFGKIREFTDGFENLFLVGRNGMHKYNNADHSMLTAMVAVDNIASGVTAKDNIWAINTEQEYHEEKGSKETTEPVNTFRNQKLPDVETFAGRDANLIGRSSGSTKYPFIIGYMWKNRVNRMLWLFGIIVFVLEFTLFKFRYPFANYMPDSYAYLDAAAANADVSIWPVAYSKILRLLSVFSHSDLFVTGLQFLFLQGAVMIFLFTICYLQRLSKAIRYFLIVSLLFNPISLYVANYVSADSMFISFSLLWLTSLIWIIYRPQPWLIVINAILVLFCFVIRYNGLYYPFISITIYLLSSIPWKWRLSGVLLSILLIAFSVFYTSDKMKVEAGHSQFSPFGGWQLANNALYMYQHIPPRQREPVSAELTPLENMVRQHMDTLTKVKFTHSDSANSYFYLWSDRGPLVQYMKIQHKNDTLMSYFKKWADEGPLYRKYGIALIKRYPLTFLNEFVGPNVWKYFEPPLEFLGTYNMGGDSVGKLAKTWFKYKTQRVARHNDGHLEIEAISWYPVFACLCNVLFLICLVGLTIFRTARSTRAKTVQLALLFSAIYFINAGFSIVASPIVLRYQIFPIIVILTASLIVADYLYKNEFAHAK